MFARPFAFALVFILCCLLVAAAASPSLASPLRMDDPGVGNPRPRSLAPPPPAYRIPEISFPASVSYTPLVATMMAQARAEDAQRYVDELSGERPTLIGGELYTITTRHTASGLPIQKATQYAYEHLQAAGLDVTYDPWTTDQSQRAQRHR